MNIIILLSLLSMKNVHCLIKVNENKIIGGREAAPGEFPFMVSVEYFGDHICGGSLLTVEHILTACHCIISARESTSKTYYIPKSASYVTALAGSVDRENKVQRGTRRTAKTLTKHPFCYKYRTGWVYDIGIVQLREKFELIQGQIELLPLPDLNLIPLEQMSREMVHCQGMGWGATDERAEEGTTHLMEVDLQLQPPENCTLLLQRVANQIGSELKFSQTTQLCTLGEEGKDACQGDSGGPLLCDNGFGRNIPVATVSWGIGCGRFDTPGVWARLDIADVWVRKMINIAASNRHPMLRSNSLISAIIMFYVTLSSCCLRISSIQNPTYPSKYVEYYESNTALSE